MNSSGEFVIRFYPCAGCGETIGGFVLQSYPVSVHVLREKDPVKIDPVTAKAQFMVYCGKCAFVGLTTYNAQCHVCSKDTSIYVAPGMLLDLKGSVATVRVSRKILFADGGNLSWCSQACLDRERRGIEVEVLQAISVPITT